MTASVPPDRWQQAATVFRRCTDLYRSAGRDWCKGLDEIMNLDEAMAEGALRQGLGTPGHFPPDLGLVVQAVEALLRTASEKRPPTGCHHVPRLSNVLSYRKPWVGLEAQARSQAAAPPPTLSYRAGWHVLDQLASGPKAESVCVSDHEGPCPGPLEPRQAALARVSARVKADWASDHRRRKA